jgi:hypothetical protein
MTASQPPSYRLLSSAEWPNTILQIPTGVVRLACSVGASVGDPFYSFTRTLLARGCYGLAADFQSGAMLGASTFAAGLWVRRAQAARGSWLLSLLCLFA